MTLAWILWLLGFIAVFAALEGYALKTGRPTLSRFVWTISKAWPPLPFVCGLIVGGLAVHFWWVGQGCDLVAR